MQTSVSLLAISLSTAATNKDRKRFSKEKLPFSTRLDPLTSSMTIQLPVLGRCQWKIFLSPSSRDKKIKRGEVWHRREKDVRRKAQNHSEINFFVFGRHLLFLCVSIHQKSMQVTSSYRTIANGK